MADQASGLRDEIYRQHHKVRLSQQVVHVLTVSRPNCTLFFNTPGQHREKTKLNFNRISVIHCFKIFRFVLKSGYVRVYMGNLNKTRHIITLDIPLQLNFPLLWCSRSHFQIFYSKHSTHGWAWGEKLLCSQGGMSLKRSSHFSSIIPIRFPCRSFA